MAIFVVKIYSNIMINEITDFNIRKFNTFGMNVNCARWIDYSEAEDLPAIFSQIGEMSWRSIGGGSNMLFMSDYNGVLLHSRILDIDMMPLGVGQVKIRVGAGVCFDELVNRCCESGFYGIENLSGIPGDTGAAAVQNIGAYGAELKDVVESVECYDVVQNKFVVLPVNECRYGYRMSTFKLPENRKRYVVTYVNIILSSTAKPNLEYGNLKDAIGAEGVPSPLCIREAVISMRDSKLPNPQQVGSAGSFFKNPVVERSVYERICSADSDVSVPHYPVGDMVKIPAAWLIERCGWKGRSLGNAAVWHKQPLVLVNATGNASPKEILSLEEAIKKDVASRFAINLEAEVDHI